MAKFEYFVVFAEMRTGSNLLEANLNRFDDLACLGEAFNSNFIGYPTSEAVLGVTLSQREDNPHLLLDAIQVAVGTNGFRYFHDHDPRILDRLLADQRCGKVVLTRNPIESYVSLKIATQTDQWKMTNAKHEKSTQIRFDLEEFADHLKAQQNFQLKVQKAMQVSGQSAFYIGYEDLNDIDVINGLAQFLGSHIQLDALDDKLKKQNPAPLSEKVSNYEVMKVGLASLDRFDLSRTPNFEPRRGPMVLKYIVAPKCNLIYLPIKAGPNAAVLSFLAHLEGVLAEDLLSGFKQVEMRQWMQEHPGHRRFTVVRHPVARAHATFCQYFLEQPDGGYSKVKQTLKNAYGLNFPKHETHSTTKKQYDIFSYEKAFYGFLKFVKNNLNSQTSLRVDPAWASQVALLQGMNEFAPIDLILREDHFQNDLRIVLSDTKGVKRIEETDPYAERLAAIYSPRIERAARRAYLRDYRAFGFKDWAP